MIANLPIITLKFSSTSPHSIFILLGVWRHSGKQQMNSPHLHVNLKILHFHKIHEFIMIHHRQSSKKLISWHSSSFSWYFIILFAYKSQNRKNGSQYALMFSDIFLKRSFLPLKRGELKIFLKSLVYSVTAEKSRPSEMPSFLGVVETLLYSQNNWKLWVQRVVHHLI